MGTVENYTTVGSEKDEVGNKAVHTNFANDREIYPLLSNPNLKMNKHVDIHTCRHTNM